MTLGLNREGKRQKHITKNGLPIGVERQRQNMLLEFIYLNSPRVVAVNCDYQKAMWKKKWHKAKFEKSQTMIAQNLEKKKTAGINKQLKYKQFKW